MNHRATSKVVNLLLDTLAKLERRVGSHPEDRAMKNLKMNVFRMVAELEAVKSRQVAESVGGQ
ncbi:MAG TPA: hypothetical protein VGS10_21625 [Terracidiphilus sp.]|nr:hypothetical protein [Terracidiphilus sp.]